MYSKRQRFFPRRGKGSVELANQPAARQLLIGQFYASLAPPRKGSLSITVRGPGSEGESGGKVVGGVPMLRPSQAQERERSITRRNIELEVFYSRLSHSMLERESASETAIYRAGHRAVSICVSCALVSICILFFSFFKKCGLIACTKGRHSFY